MSEITHSFTLNINGDTPETLDREFREVAELASELADALGKMTVHGRNYPPKAEPDVLDMDAMDDARIRLATAQRERRAMMERAQSVAEWAMAGRLEIQKQKEGR